MNKYKYPLHIMLHPVEGFEDLRWEKKGSMKVSVVLLALLFITAVLQRQLTGFIFNENMTQYLNIVPIFTSTIVVFVLWVVANWSICTLMDGEGRFKNIWIISSYSLLPYIIGTVLYTILSNVMMNEEGVFIYYIMLGGSIWSIFLLLSGMKAVHQYTFKKTLFSAVLTIGGMLIMLFLAVLVLSLFQQIYVFVRTIYSEIMFRMSV